MKKTNLGLAHYLCWFFILIGILLRFKQFSLNCSLDIDESRSAVDLLGRSFLNIIFHQLPYSDLPTLPVGLLLVQKLCVSVLGPQEGVIRLFPLLCSIGSLFLFYALIRAEVQARLGWLAIGLFALNESLIIYAASAKQYSTDILIALTAVWLFKKMSEIPMKIKDMVYFGSLGFIGMYFSYTAVFMLAAVAAALFLTHARKRDIAGIVLLWCAGFVILYAAYFYTSAGNPAILASAHPWLMPRPVFSMDALMWSMNSIRMLFENPLGLPPYLAMVLFMAGIIGLYRRDRPKFYMFVFPLLVVFAAAGLRMYPFFERYIIFLVPFLIMLVVEGCGVVTDASSRFKGWVTGCLIVFILYGPLQTAWSQAHQSGCAIRYRDVMGYLAARARPDDIVVLNSSSQFPYWYYGYTLGLTRRWAKQPMGEWNRQMLHKHRLVRVFDALNRDEQGEAFAHVRYEMFAYNEEGMIRTKDYADDYAQKVYRVYQESPFPSKSNRRVWVVFLYAPDELRQFMVRYFDHNGEQKDGFKLNGSAVYLFDVPGRD